MSYGGSQGGGSIATASDSALSNPTNGQALVYNSGTQKWTNGSVASGALTTRTVTAATTATTNDRVIFADPTTAAFTITLPTAVGFSTRLTITFSGSSANVVTVVPNGSETIDGGANATVGSQTSGATYKSLDLVSDGANWRVV